MNRQILRFKRGKIRGRRLDFSCCTCLTGRRGSGCAMDFCGRSGSSPRGERRVRCAFLAGARCARETAALRVLLRRAPRQLAYVTRSAPRPIAQQLQRESSGTRDECRTTQRPRWRHVGSSQQRRNGRTGRVGRDSVRLMPGCAAFHSCLCVCTVAGAGQRLLRLVSASEPWNNHASWRRSSEFAPLHKRLGCGVTHKKTRTTRDDLEQCWPLLHAVSGPVAGVRASCFSVCGSGLGVMVQLVG